MIAARHYAAFVAACLAACVADNAHASDLPSLVTQLIPAPAAIEPGSGRFRIEDGTRVYAGAPEAVAVARHFIALIERSRGLRLELGAGDGTDRAIRFTIAARPHALHESYEIVASTDGITVESSTPAGLFYGGVTLWQLATADGVARGAAEIPGLRIADAPRFTWRGVLLDSARHYQPPDFVKRLIDWMALHKLNVLHWHLTDDQGWRLEIRKYPLLTAIGAWRTPAGAVHPPIYGGFYSQQDVRDIVAYAAERYVTIVPEIEMPGHAQAAIASYPELGTEGPRPAVSSDWGVHDYLFNAEDSTLAFLENVLTEVVELFPGEFIHVGGDEAVKNRWQSSPRMQARIRALGLADESALQGWFVERIGRFLEARGRRLIGWDEILETGVPARAGVMSWRGVAGAVAAARAGHDVVMTPAPGLYADHLQSDLPDEPPGRPALVTLEDVYAYEPVPPGLASEEATHILGAQLNAWTEHMRLPERVSHQLFPRAAALAEVAWSPAATRDWSGFLRRLAVQFARYRRMGLAYADTAFEPKPSVALEGPAGTLRVELSNQVRFGEIRYTLDGSAPSPRSVPYVRPIVAKQGRRLRAVAFDGELPLSGELDLLLDAALVRTRTDETLEQCSGNLVLRLEDDAPLVGARPFFNVDIVNPCWIWPDVDFSSGVDVTVGVGQLPFNFQIGADANAIRRGDARTVEGELEVRVGSCDGAPVAVQPLGAAARNPEITVLPPLRMPPRPGRHDLCLRFARPAIDPIWAIQWARLGD